MKALSKKYSGTRIVLLTSLLVVILISLSDLTGWVFDIVLLRKGSPKFISMAPSTALCFILITLSIIGTDWKRNSLLMKMLPIVVLVTAFINMLDAVYGMSIDMDFFLIEKIASPSIADKQKMAEITAINFILLGTVVLLINRVKPNFLLIPISVSILTSLVAVSGYIFDVSQLYTLGDIYLISIYTVICFLILNINLIFVIKDNFISKIYFGRTPAGALLKTLVPVSFILPFLIISVSHFAVLNNIYSQEFGEAVEMTLIITILIGFVIWTVNSLHKTDMKLKESRESERHLADIVESSADAIFSRSPDGIISSWNIGAEKLYGYSKNEMIGKNFTCLIPVGQSSEFDRLIEKRMKDLTVEHFETLRKKKNGELIVVSVNVSPIFDEDNQIIGYSHIARDITEHKRDEQALRQASIYNRSLIEASIDPLVTIGHDGKITDVNKATEQVTGRPRSELIGTDFSDYFTGPQKAGEVYEKVFSQGIVRDYPLEIRSTDGHITPVIYNASTYPDESGKVIGVFAAARDVSQQKEAENALRQAGIYNRSLIDASLDPLVTIGPDGKITDVNKATEQVTGRTRSELIGTDFSDYFTEPHKARGVYEKVFSQGIVRDYALEIQHPHGRITPVLYNATTYTDEFGKVIGVFAAARDITERKEAEEEIKRINAELEQRVKDRTTELESSNKELEAFSYSVSHDLRAPLRSIDGFSKALLEDYHNKLDEEGKHYLTRIRAGTQRMGILIDDLLRISRVTRSEVIKTKVEISPVVQRIMNEMKTLFPERKIEFMVEPGVSIFADKNLIGIVFENLLSNAFKFTSKKNVAKIEFGKCVDGGKTVYFIRDNGVGFNMEYANNLFGAFQRFHSSSDYEGTGIGLATVQRIIHKHGGRIWAESEVDAGTTIFFTLD